MKIRKIQTIAALIATVGMAMPQAALAAPAKATSALQGDIAMRSGNVFVGQILSAQGAGVAGTKVALMSKGKAVAVTTTDKQGRFAVKNLRGGQYEVIAKNVNRTYRVWAPKTAPPTASNGALIVTGKNVVTAQGEGGILGFIQAYPLLSAAAVTAAVAIPVGIAAADDDPASP